MAQTEVKSQLERAVHEFVRRGFTPQFGRLGERFGTEPHWRRLRELGAQLWLDSGNIEEIKQVWTREFAAPILEEATPRIREKVANYDAEKSGKPNR